MRDVGASCRALVVGRAAGGGRRAADGGRRTADGGTTGRRAQGAGRRAQGAARRAQGEGAGVGWPLKPGGVRREPARRPEGVQAHQRLPALSMRRTALASPSSRLSSGRALSAPRERPHAINRTSRISACPRSACGARRSHHPRRARRSCRALSALRERRARHQPDFARQRLPALNVRGAALASPSSRSPLMSRAPQRCASAAHAIS
ncbi:hypothetical protein FEP76_05324 [Burkholderia multivorans]|nr:hypothetical protein [Burkholderia multivorans]MDR8975311.1 hypothetical protein [Burkholderia multivorans]